MPLNDDEYFTQNVLSTFPRAWTSDEAKVLGGLLHDFISGISQSLVTFFQNIQYAALQTRISTATAENLDALSADYFGNNLPRLNGEPDSIYRQRIIAMLTSPKVTLAAIQQIVSFYDEYIEYVGAPLPTTVPSDPNTIPGNYWALGYNYLGYNTDILSVLPPEFRPPGWVAPGGGLNLPVVSVFDIQSDPEQSAKVGLLQGDFAINTGFPISVDAFWCLGFSNLGYNTFLYNTNEVAVNPVTPDLASIVDFAKAEGSHPVYFSNAVLLTS